MDYLQYTNDNMIALFLRLLTVQQHSVYRACIGAALLDDAVRDVIGLRAALESRMLIAVHPVNVRIGGADVVASGY